MRNRIYIRPGILYQYWIFTTEDCNLKCTYCFEDNKRKGSKPAYKMEDLIRFIVDQNPWYQAGICSNQDIKEGVVFTGGEPLMNQEFIREFIARTKDELRLEYVLQTNGTLLGRIDPFLLEHLDFIFVSVDGPREIHDANRGNGTFDKIIGNIKAIRPHYNGQIMARITATVNRGFSIWDSVMAIHEHFDGFHWQIETPMTHQTTVEDRQYFVERYRNDIGRLLDQWVEDAQKGVVKNIIPFQSVIDSLAIPERRLPTPRCGAGTTLIVVGLDGQCYGCDTMVGDPRGDIGNIYDGAEPQRLNIQLAMDCSGNPFVCGAENYKNKPGCMNSCLSCSEHKDFYCSTVHALIDEITARRDLMNSLIDQQKIRLKDLVMPRAAEYTEQIP